KPMIMGRKTYDSLPGALKGRTHIVISRNAVPKENTETLRFVVTIEAAIALGKKIAQRDNVDEICVIGGGEIYRQTMPLIDRLYRTSVHKDYEGDTFFPQFDWDEWNIALEDKHESEGDRPAFTFYTLERKTGS